MKRYPEPMAHGPEACEPSHPDFGSFRAAKMTSFWDPNFTPPCGQLAAPYLYAHREPGPNFKLYTQI